MLFDLDGTLVHSGGAGWKALRAVTHKLYGRRDINHISPAGKTDPAIIREILVHIKVPPNRKNIDNLSRAYLRLLKRTIKTARGYKVYPGVREMVKTLASLPHVHMGLGTGNFKEGAKFKLSRSGLWKYFKFGGFGSDHENRVQMLRVAIRRGERLARRRFKPKDIIVIGDTPLDIKAARALGARSVAVATGPFSTATLRRHNPDVLVKNMRQHGCCASC